jgi:hypothetical protein
VLVHVTDVPDRSVLEFARWCAEEPGYTVVAVDLAPMTAPEVLEDVLEVLAACPGVLRLVPTRLDCDSTVEYGSWLVERLGRPVIAHQGAVTTIPGGGLYAPPGEGGTSGWLSLKPGVAPEPYSRRFPRPNWECESFAGPRRLGPDATLEPLPSGAWIRHSADSPYASFVAEFRDRLVSNLAPDRLLPRVVLGYPGSQTPPVDAVAEFWSSLPGAVQSAVRFSGFEWTDGATAPLGQQLADALGAPVVMSNGVQLTGPSADGGYELRTMLHQGLMSWTPYAGDLGYLPARSTGGLPADPVPIVRRPPLAGLPEREPGVYEYSDDALVEVTQSGLWVRPPASPSHGSQVRTAQADPEHVKVVFDATSPATTDRMRLLAEEMVDHLEPSVRESVMMFAATATEMVPIHLAQPAPEQTPEQQWDGFASELPDTLDDSSDFAPVAGLEPEAGFASSVLDLPFVSSDSSVVPGPAAGDFASAPTVSIDLATLWKSIDPAAVASPVPRPRQGQALGRITGADGPGLQHEAAASPPEAVADQVNAPGGAVETTPQERDTEASGLDEPIEYTAFSLVSSGTGFTVDVPAAPTVPAPEVPAVGVPLAGSRSAGSTRPAEPSPTGSSSRATEPPPATGGGRHPSPSPATATARVQAQPPPTSPTKEPPAFAPAEKTIAPQPSLTGEPPATLVSQAPDELAGAASPDAGAAGPPSTAIPRASQPAEPVVHVQPVPTAQSSAMPREGGISKEREWVRRNLSKQYDATASSVARILSENPGLRLGGNDADSDVLTDLVALRLYLTGQFAGIDAALRAAKVGPHVPVARCVASGLRRLPSYRGPLRTSAAPSKEQIRWYGTQNLVTEWSFFPALTSVGLAMPGSADFEIWSLSARRTDMIDPSSADQAVFLPGTRFKVLSVEDGARPEIRLRELTGAEVEADGTVHSTPGLDALALAGLEEAGKGWQREDPVKALPSAREHWFASLPGLLVQSAVAGEARPARTGTKI